MASTARTIGIAPAAAIAVSTRKRGGAPAQTRRWRLERRVGGNRAGKCRAGKGRGKGLGGAETGAGCGSGDAGFP